MGKQSQHGLLLDLLRPTYRLLSTRRQINHGKSLHPKKNIGTMIWDEQPVYPHQTPGSHGLSLEESAVQPTRSLSMNHQQEFLTNRISGDKTVFTALTSQTKKSRKSGTITGSLLDCRVSGVSTVFTVNTPRIRNCARVGPSARVPPRLRCQWSQYCFHSQHLPE